MVELNGQKRGKAKAEYCGEKFEGPQRGGDC